jgi:hypothetical protein
MPTTTMAMAMDMAGMTINIKHPNPFQMGCGPLTARFED